jgi:predicted nucleic acid-binding protein
MILLDTNVISELMRETPDMSVALWISARKPMHFGVTTISIAEIMRGLERLPKGKRRSTLKTNFDSFVNQAFGNRVFTFDEEAAHLYGMVAMKREKAGLHAEPVDMMIAAVAVSLKASIATRNIKDFEGCGVSLINPWESDA